MPDVKSSNTADILLKVAFVASAGYVLYDGVTTWLAGINYNVFLGVYFIIVPGFVVVRRAKKKTLRGHQALCVCLLGFVVVLYLTTKPQVWPTVWATLLVALPSILSCILLEKNRESEEDAS